MSNPQRSIAALTLSLAVVSALQAAPPDVKFLHPAGAARGSTATIQIDGKLGDRPVSAWCDRAGVKIAIDIEKPQLRVTVDPDSVPGPCLVRLFNAEGASALRPFIIGTLPELSEEEPNDAVGDAHELPEPRVVVNGRLTKSGEVDTFAVPLSAGQSLVAALAAHELGSPMDAVLQVLSPAGFVIAQNDDARGFDPLVAYTAESDGTYFVRLFAFPEEPNSTIGLAGGSNFVYRLSLTTGPWADHARPLAIPRSGEHSVQAAGWNIGEALGALHVDIPEFGEQATVWHPELANVLLLPIVDDESGREESTSEGPQTFSAPCTVTGRIEQPGEVDTFLFAGRKDQRIECRVASRVLGQPLDAVLRLLAPDGKALERVDDAGRDEADAVLEQTLPEDGTYRVEVSDLFGHGGLRYAYVLSIAEPQPHVTLTVKQDAFLLKPGEPLKIAVTLNRRSGYAEPVTITAEGLPQGVTVTPATSNAEGGARSSGERRGRRRSGSDSGGGNEVTLELLAAPAGKQAAGDPVEAGRPGDTVAPGAPFRIVATAAAGQRLAAATASVAGPQKTTAQLWVTVRGK